MIGELPGYTRQRNESDRISHVRPVSGIGTGHRLTTPIRRAYLSTTPHTIEPVLCLGYSVGLDAASPDSVQVSSASPAPGGDERLQNPEAAREPELCVKELSGLAIDELWRDAEGRSVDLSREEFAKVLLSLGLKYNYGVPPGTAATRAQIAAFWRGLQLQDLALAHACALGRETAWQQFIARFREQLTQTAISVTGSAITGQELAGSLYAELFGLTERGEQRRSPLSYYSGRGSLKGFLRAILAQRNVDHLRRSSREAPLPAYDIPAAFPASTPPPERLARLRKSLSAVLGSLAPEERFILSAWFLDGRTLLEISRILGVHEATVSRRLQRLTDKLHKELLKHLQASGMSRAAAEEALGTDPRDLDINLRGLLQASQSSTFLQQGLSAGPEQT